MMSALQMKVSHDREAVESMGFESFLHLQYKGRHLTARVEGKAPRRRTLFSLPTNTV